MYTWNSSRVLQFQFKQSPFSEFISGENGNILNKISQRQGCIIYLTNGIITGSNSNEMTVVVSILNIDNVLHSNTHNNMPYEFRNWVMIPFLCFLCFILSWQGEWSHFFVPSSWFGFCSFPYLRPFATKG